MAYDTKYLTHTFESSSAGTLGALTVGGWDVPRIRAARELHMLGRFVVSAGFAQAMKTDARVYGAWAQRQGPPASLAKSVTSPPGTEGDELAEIVRAEAAALFADTSRACPPPVRASMFESGSVLGVAVLQNIWTPRADGSWIDVRVEPFPMQAIYWNASKCCLEASTRDGVQEVRHGDGKWIVVEPYGVMSWLSGAVVPAALVFADRGWGIRDRSNFGGAHGSPAVVGELPPEEAPEGALGKAYLLEMAKLQQPRARMLEPNGAKTRYMEATSSNYQIFGSIIDGGAKDIAVAFLGQDGTSTNSGGSYTKALVLEGVLLDLVAKDVGAGGTALTSGLLYPYAVVNRGRPDLAASLQWHVPKPAEDARLTEKAARAAEYRKALQEYRALGIPVDELALAADYGVKLPLRPGAPWPGAPAPAGA